MNTAEVLEEPSLKGDANRVLSHLIIIDYHREDAESLTKALQTKSETISTITNETEIPNAFKGPSPEIILIHADFFKKGGLELKSLKTKLPGTLFILLINKNSDPRLLQELLASDFDGIITKNEQTYLLLDYYIAQAFKKKATKGQSSSTELLTQLKAQLRLQADELSQESKNKAKFISQLSSTLQKPLDQLIQFIHICLQRISRREVDKVGNYLSEIKLISEELMVYINDLKEISLLKSGESQFHLEEIDLTEFLKAIRRQYMPIASSRKIEFDFEMNLDHSFIYGDYNKLSKVLNILLRNAFKYSPEQGVVKLIASQTASNVLISVEDEGPGIAEDTQEQIFNIYDQPKNPQDGREMLGFGLSICKELMIGQKGNICLRETVSGRGAKFDVSLPIAETLLD